MKRNENLILKILEHIVKSTESDGSIHYKDVYSLFKVSDDTFDFHARLLVSDGFVNGEFYGNGMVFYGLTTSGFDYYERLKHPVLSFFKRMIADHTAMVSLFIASISLLWQIIELVVTLLKK